MTTDCNISAPCLGPGSIAVIGRCIAGDDEAWATVVRSIESRVFWLAWRFTRCREDAEDLTQEVLLRAYRRLHQFSQGEGSLQSWVMAIARNLIIDHHRQGRNLPDKAHIDELEWSNVVEGRLMDPLHAVERAEISSFVRSGLRRLPPYLRQAVQLKYIDEMEYQEIATFLNVSEGTIKSRVSRGRAQLARILKARVRRNRKRSAGRTLAAHVTVFQRG